LGKINTNVQIIAIGAIMFAASVPYGTGYYLPTIYTTVFALAVFSGAHYVFYVSRLLNEDRRQE
jgi:phosphatidylglycerophosphate synthase